MKKATGCLLLCAAIAVGAIGVAHAQQAGGDKSAAMMPPKPGDEAKMLSKFFNGTGTWTGKVPAGAMGPDSKAMTSHGMAVCKPILGGFWYSCDLTDHMGTGKNAMTWKGVMMIGYDPTSKAYKATTVDNMGAMANFDGHIDGQTLTLETPNDVMMMGQMMKDRLTFTITGENMMSFKDEHKIGEADWTTFESADCKMAAPTAAKTTKKATTTPSASNN